MSPKRPTANLQVLPTIESVSSENSPCPSPLPQLVLSPGSTPSPMPFLELPTSEEDKQRSLSPSPDNHAGFSQEPDSEKQDLEGSEKDKSEPTSPVRSRSGTYIYCRRFWKFLFLFFQLSKIPGETFEGT